jgi:hypothetical protein
LTDMEELIATVSDKDVADYLREALVCYGTGAHRACIVLTHIALFDGLRRKVKTLAPVNAVAKKVSDEIEPLATAQKVFETPLIQKLKAAAIITHLEAQLLEQLNNQRNKAAHPSGHVVTAEEARFVFSETIQKFLSQPLRETSYVVDHIMEKIGDKNFFPSTNLGDMEAVVDQELANLDKMAMPFLIAKLVQAWDGGDSTAVKNSRDFLLALVERGDPDVRAPMIKALIDPKSSNDSNAEFFSMLATCDPEILTSVGPGTRLRYRALLLNNAKTLGVALPYQQLRNPAKVLGSCLNVLSETFMLTEMKEFTDWVIEKSPYSPEFIADVSGSPKVFVALFARYLTNAASSQWATSNALASAAPAMDEPLSIALTGKQSFEFLAAIVRGADSNGFGPLELANNAFSSLPNLKAKAQKFVTEKPITAAAILKAQNVTVKGFSEKYLA